MNIFCYVKQGEWQVGPGGYPWPTLVGPFSTSQIAEKVKWELMAKFPPQDQPYPRKNRKKVMSITEIKYKSAIGIVRSRKTRQVGGDFGDALAYDGMWRRGSDLLILDNIGECQAWDEWRVFTFDLKDIKYLDDWVEWDRVASCCGVEDRQWYDSVTKMEDAASYYGWNQVAGEPDTYTIRKQLLDRLADFGVEVDGYRQENDDLPSEEQLQAWREGDLYSLEGSTYAFLKKHGRSTSTSETRDAVYTGDVIDKLPQFVKLVKKWKQIGYMSETSVGFDYPIEHIYKDNQDRVVVKIGCNRILLSEIIRFVRDDLGLPTEADELESIMQGEEDAEAENA